MLKIRNSNRSWQQQPASQPANICWKKKREQIKGSAVQMLVVLVPGTTALPSATHTGRPGIQNRLSP